MTISVKLIDQRGQIVSVPWRMESGSVVARAAALTSSPAVSETLTLWMSAFSFLEKKKGLTASPINEDVW